MSIIGLIHGRTVHSRRVHRLCTLISELIPPDSCVLDVGCGDGKISEGITHFRADVDVLGVDVRAREESRIPVTTFDGNTLPFESNSFDVVMFVDVLHHTSDPMVLLLEASRVSRRLVLIKDHNDEGLLSTLTLRIMDWIGNKPHGVALPFNYWKRTQWDAAFSAAGLTPRQYIEQLSLYPPVLDQVFGRGLHFLSALEVTENALRHY